MIEMLAGALFAGFGALALTLARNYPSGSALDMGPGYLPRLVAVGLVVIGLIGIVRGAMRRGRRLPEIPLRPLLWICSAILVFAGLIERLGLFVACLVTVLVAAGAQAQARWREAPLIAVGLAAFCAILFGTILGLPVPIWPR
jgi:hypothetical protein